jgi:putative ABC transport system permease protein
MTWRWTWRELRNNLPFALFFCVNLAVGLTGFLCLDAFKTSLSQTLQENSKFFLSADLGISARRQLTDSEKQQVQKVMVGIPSQTGSVWELFSMVATKDSSRLVSIKAIDDTYPFYGSLTLSDGEVITGESPKLLMTEPVVWVYPELLSQLHVQIGDEISIGRQKFKIADTVIEDSSQTFRMSSLAPKVFIGLPWMKKTNLVQFGTTMSESLLLRVPPKFSSASDLAALAKTMREQITDPAVHVQTPDDVSQDTGQAIKYLADYLGLVSLVALFLATLGTAYLFRGFLFSRLKSIAVLNALGLQKSQAQRLYLWQLSLLGIISAIISLTAALLLLPLLAKLLASFAPMHVSLALSWKTISLAFAMGILGSLLVGWPLTRPLLRLQTQELLQEGGEISLNLSWKDFLGFLPALIFYWLLAVWQSSSLRTGSYFILIFLGSLIALLILGYLLLWVLKPLARKGSWYFKQAILALTRKRVASLGVIVALGLGALLMNLLPQIKVSLEQDLAAPKDINLPSLFMFDIQEEQKDPLIAFLKGKKIDVSQVSPLVRARILKVNGQNFERTDRGQAMTREEEAQARLRNRGVNLSYRENLSPSETLEEGHDFSGRYSESSGKLPELSVEEKYAQQLNLHINDVLTFDVQGIELQGKIVNLRSVRWNSFQPNFFILMQPGVLDEAPKTYLAALPAMPANQSDQLQTEIVQRFSNVSMVDVTRLVKRIFDISNRMSWSLQLMAALSMLAGFVVLYSMASHQIASRRWDLNMMKVLGAKPQESMAFLLIEFGGLGFLSALFGVLISLVVSYLASKLFFEGTYQFDLFWPTVTLILVTALSLMLTWLAARRVIREKPLAILQGQ